MLRNRDLSDSYYLSKPLTSRHVRVYGPGFVGDKAGERIAKLPATVEAGFEPNPFSVLTTGFFRDFYGRNGVNEAIRQGMGPEVIRDRIWHGNFSADEHKVFLEISGNYKHRLLIARSTAFGDADGTGVYGSEIFKQQDLSSFERHVKHILSSQFTPTAMAFRRCAGLPEGMAVTIEPLIGNRHRNSYSCRHFAPPLAGFGYALGPDKKSHIEFVYGLGSRAVSGRDGIRVFENEANKKINEIYSSSALHRAMLQHICSVDTVHGVVASTAAGNLPSLIGRDETFAPLFEKMDIMARLCGPQYFEWAAQAVDGGKLKFYLLQIAGVKPETVFPSPADPARVLFTASELRGSGCRECTDIVYLHHPDDVKHLIEYNNTHSNYLLVYSGGLVKSDAATFGFPDCDNASVVLEISGREISHAIRHWGGVFQASNKLFASVDLSGFNWQNLDDHSAGTVKIGGMHVIKLKVRVTAGLINNESQLIVEALPGQK
nr:PEP/pyruvate-binding domain-containing protein [Candidatus Burarchaeum sp.]